jgi:GNAT superfamily N-acetyltransferase
MIDARHFTTRDTLRNGTEVTVRSVRADDRERIAVAFSKLERDSVYRRFFTYRAELGEGELAHLADIDFKSEVMLIATVPTKDLEVVIGSTRYVEVEPREGARAAEVAFTVEEDFQGIGLGGRLLAHLADIARDNGFAWFEADVLRENKGMLKVFERTGWPMRHRHEGTTVHITLALSASGPTPAR